VYTTSIAMFTFGPGNMSPKGHEKRRFSIQTAEKVLVLAQVGNGFFDAEVNTGEG
jgi:hypothetical protein